jgi:hypothetical protein
MLLASVIAWRNEPVPLSFVFITVKTKGVVGLCTSGDSCATVASGSLAFRTPVGRVERVALNALAKLEASKSEQIANKATGSIIRSAKARAGVFFFILFFWG